MGGGHRGVLPRRSVTRDGAYVIVRLPRAVCARQISFKAPRGGRGVRATGREQAHEGLLGDIAGSKTSAELLTVLRANEEMILSSNYATVYLSEAWDVLLQQHHGTRGRVWAEGSSDVSDVSDDQWMMNQQVGRGRASENHQDETGGRRKSHQDREGDRRQLRTLQGYMLEHTMPLVAEFSPASISMIARAMVATRTGAAADIASISLDVQSRLVRFEPRELCMVLWSLSSHPGMDEQQKQGLFKSLAGLVRQGMGMDNFTAKDLSILVWAIGHVAYRDRVLLQAAEEEAVKKHAEFTAEDISRLFHGFASVNYNPHTLIPHVSVRYSAPNALEEFASRDLALLIVSLGKLVVEPSGGFSKALVARARDLVPLTSKASSKVNSAGIGLGHGDDDMFDVHLNALVMWSFARLGLKKTAYATRSLKYMFLGTNIEGHALEDLVAVMWACCRLDIQLNSGQVARCSKALCRVLKQNGGEEHGTGKQRHRGRQDQIAPAMCRGFRYLSMLYSKRKEGGRAADEDAVTERNARLLVEEIFTGGFADHVSSWEVASVIVALGAFADSSDSIGSLKSQSKPFPLRRMQRYLTASISDVDSTLLAKLTYTIAKLGLAKNNAAVLDSLSSTIVSKSGIIPAPGLVQIAYSFASMGSHGSAGATSSVAHAIAPKLLESFPNLSSKDRARACFSMYQLAKRSGDRDTGLHLAYKDMLLQHITEADVVSLDASTAFGIWLAFGSVALRHGADRSVKGALRNLRGWLVDSSLKRVHRIASIKQIAGIQKVLADTMEFDGSGSSENLMGLLSSRMTELR